MPFDHNVFISFSSADREWANRLNDSLSAPGRDVKTFFDSKSVRAGDDWETEIEKALERTQHLIVLWTDQGKLSDWVTREYMTFNSRAKPKEDSTRRMIFVNLQGANQAFMRFQHITSHAIQDAYAAGVAAPNAAWDELLIDLMAGLDPNTRPLPIPLVTLTLTRDELVKMEPKRWDWIKSDFRVSPKRLLMQYGPTRNDWRPFATSDSVTAVLANARIEMNKALKGRRAEWRIPDASFWDNRIVAKHFVEQEFKTSEISLLIIDPVAICHPDVFERLMLFQDCFTSTSTVIAMLPPFGVPRRIAGLKRALLSRGTPYFDDYLEPTVPPRRRLAAQVAFNVIDADDIRRHLVAAAGQLVPDIAATERSPFLQHGSLR